MHEKIIKMLKAFSASHKRIRNGAPRERKRQMNVVKLSLCELSHIWSLFGFCFHLGKNINLKKYSENWRKSSSSSSSKRQASAAF